MVARTAYDQDQYETNYPDGFENNYWNRARHRTLRQALAAFDPGEILDVGCGRGPTVAFLRTLGLEAWGVELGAPSPLEEAAPYVTVGTDAVDLPEELRNRINCILLLDVIEHIEAPVEFLQRLATGFPNLRCVLVTVPARQELWSNYDVTYGHFLRYDLETLATTVEKGTGFTVRKLAYFFRIFYLPGLIARVLGGRETVIRSPRLLPLHELVARISRSVDLLLPGWVPGSSALCVAEATRAKTAARR